MFASHPAASAADPLSGIVRASVRGDEPAVRRLLLAVTPAVVAVVGRALGSGDPECDDVVQEALVSLLRALAQFRFECTVVHFARRVALRTATTTLRNRGAARRDANATMVDSSIGDSLASPETQPDEVAVSRRRTDLLRELIAGLPGAQAEAIGLKVLLGYSIEEVSETTQSNVNTVRSRLQMAKQAIRDRVAHDARFAELREETER